MHPAGNAGYGHHGSATELRWDGIGNFLDAKTSLWVLEWEVAESDSLRHLEAPQPCQPVGSGCLKESQQ